MPFRQGKKPALRVPVKRLEALVISLMGAGYQEHDGRKVKLKSEVLTFRRRFVANGKRRQCHVQVIVTEDGKHLDVFAHTEPDMAHLGDVFTHGFSAIMDHANYAAGARMLRQDLKAVAFDAR